MEQLTKGVTKGDSLLPLTAVMQKARCYSQYVTLLEHQLVESDEADRWFEYINFTKAELQHLEKVNLQNFHIKLD